jgi:hypothetical protein
VWLTLINIITVLWSPVVKNFSAMNPVFYFLHIYYLDFLLEEKSCLQTLKRFYRVTSLWRNPLVKIIFFENQDDLCFLWKFGLWILTTWPFHSCSLAYCRPIYLISIEFQNIDDNRPPHQKNFSFSFKCYNLAICVVTLAEIFSTNY